MNFKSNQRHSFFGKYHLWKLKSEGPYMGLGREPVNITIPVISGGGVDKRNCQTRNFRGGIFYQVRRYSYYRTI